MSCDKRIYLTKSEAKLSLKQHPEWSAKTTYRCWECGNWHLTSADAQDKYLIREYRAKMADYFT